MKKRSRGACSRWLTGVSAFASLALGVCPVAAQDVEDETAFVEEDEIVVTGTRIPQRNLYTTSPITQVSAEDITTQGVTRLEDLTNQLPQVFASQGSAISNGSTGTATIDLRGLGPPRTLVLIDGRRMGYGSPLGVASDLNQIPGPLVERVEVLTGGASAVYGSDAIAGVTNFIMRRDFEGFRFDAQYGFYQHENDSDADFIREEIAFRGLTNPEQYQLPPDHVVDGYSKEITFVFGASTPDGRGNVSAYLGYRNNDPVLQRDRDYSACALAGGNASPRPYAPPGTVHWLCGGSSLASQTGRFTNFGLGGAPFNYTIDQATGNFIPFAQIHLFNFAPLNYYQRPDERYTGGAFARYQINSSIEIYGNAMLSDYRSIAQIAPSGAFFNTNTLNCGNPLLTPGNAAAIGCDPGEIAADSPVTVYVGRRNVEGGPRRDDLNYMAYRLVLGARGPIGENWDYDVFGQYYRAAMARSYNADFLVERLTRALDVIDADPGPGIDPQCRSFVSGLDLNCVPYDIFTPGGVTDAALDYLQAPFVQRGETVLQNIVASVTGETGLRSPWAAAQLYVAFGVEYRRDVLITVVDENFQIGAGTGQGTPTPPLNGDSEVAELFGEARFPLLEGAPFVELLSIDAAYRLSHPSEGSDVDTYKIGLEWAPTPDIRFRGSHQRAIRAANVIELFTPQADGGFGMRDDPCGADTAGDGMAAAAVCVGTNPWQVTAAQYGTAALNSPFNFGEFSGYNSIVGGNPNLQPEEADTYTLGLVFTPGFLPGFSLTLDYFDIEVTGAIGFTGANNTARDCYLNDSLASCSRIVREPGTGFLWRGPGVEDLLTNIGGISTSGYDINVNYRLDVGAAGVVGVNLIGTLLQELVIDPGAITQIAPFECVGGFGGDCGAPNPEWRHRFRVSWETPWDLELFATWRYYGEVEQRDELNAPIPGLLDSVIPSVDYFDLAGNAQLRSNAVLRFGVNNVLDDDPPLSAALVFSGALNGNTFPQVYNALGRFVFVGLTVDF
jgi:outer membrane receptor protein involved in Fe transport